MKTTVDIPDETLKEAMRYLRAKTKREAIVFALDDFNRRRRLAALAKTLGSFVDFMRPQDLTKARRGK